ncbi:transcription initiation factor TFIID subunit 4b-like [Tripterygium wilfordii]|uniref:Transcription initiation factor TFIID subunit 4b-like n=1 Tax=Tripterygium wilfordii TaxID=458696 RepID=A0A7J7DNP3_TRIWF|nr:transcription initiation factor TFIID subunit 4b-like isoform X2 [Tripterygium wilfordii]KAF5747990.1 transcription initiation factor TFIID subunit 4b-like [Tripterygium wilfordii]
MDPDFVKFLEEDEDETMHSSADVEAFQAALNRDIKGGGDASTSIPSDSGLYQESFLNSSQPFPQWQTAGQGETDNPQSQQDLKSELSGETQSAAMEVDSHCSVVGSHQEHNNAPQDVSLRKEQSQVDHEEVHEEKIPTHTSQPAGMRIFEKPSKSTIEPDKTQNQDSEMQYLKLQKMSNQQVTDVGQANEPVKVPFGELLPRLQSLVDKDRSMQLQKIFDLLRNNDIRKDQFIRAIKGIVGDQVLRTVVEAVQTKGQTQAVQQQRHLRTQPVSGSPMQYPGPRSFAHQHRGPSFHADSSHFRPAVSSSLLSSGNSTQMSHEESDSHGSTTATHERERSSISVHGYSKLQQQHMHFPQASQPMYGSGGNHHLYRGSDVNSSGSSLKPQFHDEPMTQGMGAGHVGATQSGNVMSLPKFERQSSVNDPNRVQGGSHPNFTNNPALQHNPVPRQGSTKEELNFGPMSSMTNVKQEPVDQGNEQQQKSQLAAPPGLSAAPVELRNAISGTSKDESSERQSSRVGYSTSTSLISLNLSAPSVPTTPDPSVPFGSRTSSVTSSAGFEGRTPPKKPAIGQKKLLEAFGSSPSLPSKKQKVSGTFADQSIEHLNDVTAVSGVNLREEEEQLFSGPKEDSRVSEASRRVVQEEEERLILQRTPLQKKLAEIMARFGLKNMSNDVERCLSLCVEERLRGFISNLMRLSKQRMDAEKPRHRTVITADIRQQIMMMNQKAKEEWERKQAEAEKLRKNNEPDSDSGVEDDKEKDEARTRSLKANKEEDDKMRTTAANVAARAAVGGDDMLSKWQLMAEARQKRGGGLELSSGSQTGKDANGKPSSTSGKILKDNQDAEKRGPATFGASRKLVRNEASLSQTRVACSISVKDVVAVLEREPQMSKSTLMYRLHEKIHSDTAAE